MSFLRLEEASDSDPDVPSDPEEGDIDDFLESDIIRRVPSSQPQSQPRTSTLASSTTAAAAAAQPHILNPASLPFSASAVSVDDHAAYKGFQSLYPVYFDASRSRAEGRRVNAALAVKDPLARDIANACSRLRLHTLLEPEKIHPKDWANPGRVKVGLKKAGTAASVHNKHHLYILVARHLRENPTTEDSPGLRVNIGGHLQPPEGQPYPRPAVPRGWKMGELLPYLSAAMTGGGVSENLFKDMMKEMQSGGDPMAALMAAQQGAGPDEGGGAKKKDKKGKTRT